MPLVSYSENHLSFFEMAGFVHCASLKKIRPLVTTIENIYKFLTDTLSIQSEDLLVSISNGGKFENIDLQPDEDSEILWRSIGLNNIIRIPGRRNFVYRKVDGSFAGPTYEIFYISKSGTKQRYIEIGSTINMKYLFKGGKLFPLKINSGISVGFGLERLSMALQEKYSIFEIDTISIIKEKLSEKLKSKIEAEIEEPHLKVIIDRLRAILFIVYNGQRIESTGRGKLLNRLIKEVIKEMEYLSIFSIKTIEEVCIINSNLNKNRYPNLEKSINNVIEIFEKVLHGQ